MILLWMIGSIWLYSIEKIGYTHHPAEVSQALEKGWIFWWIFFCRPRVFVENTKYGKIFPHFSKEQYLESEKFGITKILVIHSTWRRKTSQLSNILNSRGANLQQRYLSIFSLHISPSLHNILVFAHDLLSMICTQLSEPHIAIVKVTTRVLTQGSGKLEYFLSPPISDDCSVNVNVYCDADSSDLSSHSRVRARLVQSEATGRSIMSLQSCYSQH